MSSVQPKKRDPVRSGLCGVVVGGSKAAVFGRLGRDAMLDLPAYGVDCTGTELRLRDGSVGKAIDRSTVSGHRGWRAVLPSADSRWVRRSLCRRAARAGSPTLPVPVLVVGGGDDLEDQLRHLGGDGVADF